MLQIHENDIPTALSEGDLADGEHQQINRENDRQPYSQGYFIHARKSHTGVIARG